MNAYQELWWRQTKSDHSVLLLLRDNGYAPCHQLHYLQMVTEKLGKAYFWRSGQTPPKGHARFVQFLRALNSRSSSDLARIAKLLGFGNVRGFENWIPTIAPLAYALEQLAPALSGDNRPNPEYPWPHIAPLDAPVSFQFQVWTDLCETEKGRKLLKVIDALVTTFPEFG